MTTPSTRARIGVVVRWSAVWLLVFGCTALWSLSMPLMASPDEPSHAIKAVAVVRGQLVGEVGPRPTTIAEPGAFTTVHIPSDYAIAQSLTCYVQSPLNSAACLTPVPSPAVGDVPTRTAAGQYPPLYYALVGWPSLILPADVGFMAMRLVSAALSSTLLTAGFAALWRMRDRRVIAWGAAVAITPMTIFLAGSVNPNGLEVTAAFAMWASALALGDPTVTVRRRSLWVQLAVSAAVLANIRALSPLWVVVVLAISALVADRAALRTAVRDRDLIPAAAVATVAVGVSLAWTLRHGALLTGVGLWPRYNDITNTVKDMVGSAHPQYLQMIGNFGWLDTPAPFVTVTAWTAALGALLLLALALPGTSRQRIALGILIAGVIVGPMVLEFPSAPDAGLVWQGRYTLPIAIGVPLVAAVLLARQRPVPLVHRRAAAATVLALGLANALAFYWASRRYSVGTDGEILTLAPAWSSPVGYLPGVAAYTALVMTICVVAYRASAQTTAAPRDSVPAPSAHAQALTQVGDGAATGVSP